MDEDALHGTVYLKCENAPCDVYFDAENLNVGSDAQVLAAMRLGIRIIEFWYKYISFFWMS